MIKDGNYTNYDPVKYVKTSTIITKFKCMTGAMILSDPTKRYL